MSTRTCGMSLKLCVKDWVTVVRPWTSSSPISMFFSVRCALVESGSRICASCAREPTGCSIMIPRGHWIV